MHSARLITTRVTGPKWHVEQIVDLYTHTNTNTGSLLVLYSLCLSAPPRPFESGTLPLVHWERYSHTYPWITFLAIWGKQTSLRQDCPFCWYIFDLIPNFYFCVLIDNVLMFFKLRIFSVCIVLTNCVSPWYDRHGWLGVNNQLSIYLSIYLSPLC